MIEVTVFRSNNQITAFTVSGHAESGPYGYDLVCAGVSAITFGTANAVMELCNIDLEIEAADDGGYLHVQLPDRMEEALREKASLLFAGMLISLETIERDYHRFIKIQSK